MVTLQRDTTLSVSATDGGKVLIALLPAPVYPVWSTVTQTIAVTNALPPSVTFTGRLDENVLGSAQYLVAEKDTYVYRPSTITTNVLGGMPIVGTAAGKQFIYAPGTLTGQLLITGTVADATTSTIIVYQVEYFNSTGQVEPGILQFVYPWVVGQVQSTQSEAVTPAHKWLRVISGHIIQFGGIPDGATAPATLTSAFNSTYVATGAWLPYPMEAPLAFSDSVEPYRWARVNASALLASNATAVLNKEGTVLAGRLATTTVLPWSATEANIHAIPPQLRYFRPLEGGFRTYTLPPTQNGSFIDTYGAWGTTTVPVYPLELNCMFTLLALSDPSTATPTTLAISYHQHREFVPTTQLFPVSVSRISIDQYVKLLQQATLYPPVLANRQATFGVIQERRSTNRGPSNRQQKSARQRNASKQEKKQRRQRVVREKRQGQPQVMNSRPAKGDRRPISPPQKPKLRSGLDMYLEQRAKTRKE